MHLLKTRDIMRFLFVHCEIEAVVCCDKRYEGRREEARYPVECEIDPFKLSCTHLENQLQFEMRRFPVLHRRCMFEDGQVVIPAPAVKSFIDEYIVRIFQWYECPRSEQRLCEEGYANASG